MITENLSMLPSFCNIQLQSSSMFACTKYLPSVHNAAFLLVITAVPKMHICCKLKILKNSSLF